MAEWRDLIILTAGFALSIVGALIGAAIQRMLNLRGELRPLNQLLNFGKDELLFVFPHREDIPESILPRTSTEDFLAMNNFISALINIGWKRKIGVRDTHRLSHTDKKKNLLIICSPKSNDFSKEFQETLMESVVSFFWFERSQTDPKEWQIKDGDAELKSKSYLQEKRYLDNKCDRRDLAGNFFEDYAVITKASNPWNDKNKVLLLAGIRGIGTWGAAECIKKEWNQIYEKLPEKEKDVDFSALLKIQYDNCDITGIDVRRIITIEPKGSSK